MKTLVIIIPGSQPKQPWLIGGLLERAYRYFRVEMGPDDWAFELAEHVRDGDTDAEVFFWSGGITETLSLRPAAQQLGDIVRARSPHYTSIILFGKSLGGIVAEIAAGREPSKIRKLIYVSTPHRSSSVRLSDVDIINIHSHEDAYVTLANRLLYLGLGKKKLSNARNVEIPHMGHSEFNTNKSILHAGQRIGLFDLYKGLISETHG